LTLQYASEELKNNYDIVKKAVINNGYSLEYANDDLKNNFELNSIAQSNYEYKENNIIIQETNIIDYDRSEILPPVLKRSYNEKYLPIAQILDSELDILC
jgi:hypothetical protein